MLAGIAVVFVVGAVVPTRIAADFVLRLGNEGLLLGMLALSVAFLMNQAGLVALGAASIYGGSGLLFAIGGIGWTTIPILIGAYARRTSVQRGFSIGVAAAIGLCVVAMGLVLTVR